MAYLVGDSLTLVVVGLSSTWDGGRENGATIIVEVT